MSSKPLKTSSVLTSEALFLCAVRSSILFRRISLTVFGVSMYSGTGKPAWMDSDRQYSKVHQKARWYLHRLLSGILLYCVPYPDQLSSVFLTPWLILTFLALHNNTKFAGILTLRISGNDIIDLRLEGTLIHRRQLFQLMHQILHLDHYRLKTLQQCIDTIDEEIINLLRQFSAWNEIINSLCLQLIYSNSYSIVRLTCRC